MRNNLTYIVCTVARCFSPHTAKCNWFHCQMAWKIYARYGLHFSAILSIDSGMRAYICRWFIPTTALFAAVLNPYISLTFYRLANDWDCMYLCMWTCTCRHSGRVGTHAWRTFPTNSSWMSTARPVIGRQHVGPRRSTRCVSTNACFLTDHVACRHTSSAITATTLCLKKNVPPSTCYNLNMHDPITIIFGRSVTQKVWNIWWFDFPPHLSSASALPCEIGNPEDSTLVHCVCNTVQLVQCYRLPFTWTIPQYSL